MDDTTLISSGLSLENVAATTNKAFQSGVGELQPKRSVVFANNSEYPFEYVFIDDSITPGIHKVKV